VPGQVARTRTRLNHMKILRAVLLLGRVSNLPTVWSNTLTAWFLAGGDWRPSTLASLTVGTSLLYLGGTTLNDFFDAAFDRQYRKERPIPQDILSRQAVGCLGFGYLASGSAVAVWGAAAWWPWILGLNAAILLYDWLHKRWLGSVLLMAACRALLILAAASCITQHAYPWQVWLHAIVIFGYIMGLTFTARGESRSEPMRSWPLALLFLPLGAGIWIGWDIWWYTIPLALLFLGVLVMSLRYLMNRDDPSRIGRAVSLMLAGIASADALLLASHQAMAAVALICHAVARLLQRVIPAT